jgi:hypothetical protein
MYRDHQPDPHHAGEATPTAPRCPDCGSPKVTTTSKVVTPATYWRCAACGEVWNVGRRKTGGRYTR